MFNIFGVPMMYRRLAAFLFLFLFFCGCKKDQQVVVSNPDFSVDRFYGVGGNGRAIVAWEALNPYINTVDLYRSSDPVFSKNSAIRLGRWKTAENSLFVDSNVVNGTPYYYTLVPFHVFQDGAEDAGTNPTSISLTPRDYSVFNINQIIYSQHIQPIFTNGCAIAGCHSGTTDGSGHSLVKRMHGGSDYSLLSWNDAMRGTNDVAQIVPFRASKSHIIQHLNADTTVAPVAQPSMPPGFSFPKEVRDFLIAWINAGAQDDDGSVAYSTTPSRGWGYVTNQGEDLTAVIDLDRFKIARYVTTGAANTSTAPPQSPHNAVVDGQNQFYYINLIGGNKLLKFRVVDNAKVGEMTSGLTSPAQVAVSRFGDTAYVTNFFSSNNNITVVNTATMTKLFDIADPAVKAPHGAVMTGDFRRVIVTNSTSDNVTVIRTSDNVIEKVIPIAADVPPVPVGSARYEPYQCVVTPDNKFAFITCRKSNEVRVVDLAQMTVIDSITVGMTPLIPAITPDGNHVFVANRNSHSVSVINTSTRKVEYTVENVGVEPHGIAVSKDGLFVYVSCENLGVSEPPHHPTVGSKKPGFIKVIDVSKRAVVQSLEVGNFGSGIAVTR